MKKSILILSLQVLFAGVACAQDEHESNNTATQSVKMILQNSIDISYTTTGNANGSEATMTFSNPNDYSNGVMSVEQELRVRSNKSFKVAVKCDENSFSYEGNSTIQPASIPNDALWVKVTKNNTGGNVRAPFSTNSFAALSAVNQDLLVNGQNGGNQTFAVMYKCTPGFSMPAGNYSINVVYTATQE